MSVLHLFIAILAVLSVSIIISVVNWVLQARVSSRISLLETELRKKTAEFDAIKKERATFQAHVPMEVDISNRLDEPIEPQLVDNGEIRIMRNVRGTFSEALDDRPPAAYQGNEMQSRHDEPLNSPKSHDQPIDPALSTGQIFKEDTRHLQQQIPSISDAAPFPTLQPSIPVDLPIRIALYSPSAGGADFNALYNACVDLLKSGSNQGVAFDCGGIQFLSEPEIEYLEKMCWSLVSQNRSLQLVNCSNALLPLLQQRGQLATLIR